LIERKAMKAVPSITFVIAGLDPAIQHRFQTLISQAGMTGCPPARA
jgi:hypothetical protein